MSSYANEHEKHKKPSIVINSKFIYGYSLINTSNITIKRIRVTPTNF